MGVAVASLALCVSSVSVSASVVDASVSATTCPHPVDGMGASFSDYAKGVASWQTNDVAVEGADGRVALTFNLS